MTWWAAGSGDYSEVERLGETIATWEVQRFRFVFSRERALSSTHQESRECGGVDKVQSVLEATDDQ